LMLDISLNIQIRLIFTKTHKNVPLSNEEQIRF
jgi:hypothetical protein